MASPDARTRVAALGALERTHGLDPAMLHAALHDPAPSVVARATELAAQAFRGHHEIDIAVLQLLRNDNADLVEVAAWALGERHGTDDGPADLGSVAVEGAADEGAADDVEGRSAHNAATDVVHALSHCATSHGDALCREAAVAALGSIGDPRGKQAVLCATTDKATVRRRAVIALAAFSGADVIAALDAALTDRDWQVRQAAEDLR